jgi:hypothetical protein
MAITRNNPNKVLLGDMRKVQTIVGDIAAAVAITPGALVQRDRVTGVIRWKVAAADIDGPPAVAIDMPYLNKGVDDACAIGDLIDVAVLGKGDIAWMFVASGATIEEGDLLGSHGTSGQLKLGATKALFTALETKVTPYAALTRIRVEAL